MSSSPAEYQQRSFQALEVKETSAVASSCLVENTRLSGHRVEKDGYPLVMDINDKILWFVNPPREVGVCGVPRK